MASPQVSQKGFFGRFRIPNTAARPESPIPSASSTPSLSISSVGPTNTELFEQCFQNLLAEEDETKDLQDQVTKFEDLIACLKKRIQDSDSQDHRIESLESGTRALNLQIEEAKAENSALIQNQKAELSDLREQLRCVQTGADGYAKQFTVQSDALNTLQSQCDNMKVELGLKHTINTNLELQVDLLATQVAQATIAAHKREKLTVKLQAQLQQLAECHTEEEQSHAQQKQALDSLYDMNKADQQRFETQLEAQNLIIMSLQKKVDKAEMDKNIVAVTYDDKVTELNEKLRCADLDLQTEVAKNVAWAQYGLVNLQAR